MEVKTVPIESIFLDPNNTRDHAAKNLNAIKGSLAKFQQVEPLVVQKSKKIIIGGNGRYRAMQEMGYKEVQIVEVDVDDLQAAALSITLNRTAELATWNDDLSVVLKSLREANFDVGDIGFDAKDLEVFCPTPIPEGKTDPDAVPENVETRCNPGDLWILGGYMECDCGEKHDL